MTIDPAHRLIARASPHGLVANLEEESITIARYSIRTYLDVTGAPILPASVSIGVNHKVFPSTLMLSRVKFPSA